MKKCFVSIQGVHTPDFELHRSMMIARQVQAEGAATAQHCFELLYPLGALVEFIDGDKWCGPAIVTKNRIGFIGPAHTPSMLVKDIESNCEININHPEYVRLVKRNA